MVWAPDAKLTRVTLVFCTACLIALILYGVPHPGVFITSLYTLCFLVTGVVLSASALLRPVYISTDDAGIALKTRSGTRALRWSEVTSAELAPMTPLCQGRKLVLLAPDRTNLDLSGHKSDRSDELLLHIAERAGLTAGPGKTPCLYARHAASALAPNSTPGS